jgi:hypothetical protein
MGITAQILLASFDFVGRLEPTLRIAGFEVNEWL